MIELISIASIVLLFAYAPLIWLMWGYMSREESLNETSFRQTVTGIFWYARWIYPVATVVSIVTGYLINTPESAWGWASLGISFAIGAWITWFSFAYFKIEKVKVEA